MDELDDLDGIKRNIEAVAVMMIHFSPGKQEKMYYSPEDIASALNSVHVAFYSPLKKIVMLNDRKIISAG